ncbi:HGGxSTG domain-containing protein [Streptomyces sp. FL07-04A]|uniref:HGGxSTG domain-containing protein n=1 Tax=Streptomyces sp. FL07-04A TaxID=3028658 RepID=UPI0029A2AC56|nr:HGGxSTG domain-containing protein [Streptomyces sp. FL07-04A]MDX3578664.1 HGGxSTG domain-containing protein [Streptomyces sp. FL07-04A]
MHPNPDPPPHARTCGARRRDGGSCTNPPMNGGERCRMHGGSSPQAKAAAERRTLEADVSRLLAELDVAPVGDPLAGLLKLAGQVVTWQASTAALVNSLESTRYRAANGTEQLRAEVALYERAMDRAANVLGAIARLNIEERLARVSEQQAEAVIGAIEAGLVAAGVPGERMVDARRAVARHLRLVEGAGA